ncbi:MAG TPA: HAD-IA family hydrolase [Candidatus Dormibacteraeota bacterium]|nr:HAD-IA family hydrolase [Candidatus Dormibacteraeota bacterium]
MRALVFDFDGLILETEIPVMESWRRVYKEHGVELPMATWLETIGTADHEFDPFAHLQEQVGHPLEREPMQSRRILHRDAVLHAQETLPGVLDYIDAARRVGLKLAIASSSRRQWVVGHLERLGIHPHWDAIKTADDVARTKPDPALYLAAVEALGVEPREAVAFEDSRNGVLAAKAAGLWCVAVPANLTRDMDLSEADVVLRSLSELSLDDLLARLGA